MRTHTSRGHSRPETLAQFIPFQRILSVSIFHSSLIHLLLIRNLQIRANHYFFILINLDYILHELRSVKSQYSDIVTTIYHQYMYKKIQSGCFDKQTNESINQWRINEQPYFLWFLECHFPVYVTLPNFCQLWKVRGNWSCSWHEWVRQPPNSQHILCLSSVFRMLRYIRSTSLHLQPQMSHPLSAACVTGQCELNRSTCWTWNRAPGSWMTPTHKMQTKENRRTTTVWTIILILWFIYSFISPRSMCASPPWTLSWNSLSSPTRQANSSLTR